ncbi:MAG: TetR/AcrR family transcriptional regulator [Myxococcota bacterium]
MTAHRPPLQSVSRPKQARSEQTLFRILDAAEALIEEKGLADAPVPEIVRRAGSSVGGFYARFRDKSELLRALEERFYGQVVETLETVSEPSRWEGVSVPGIVRALVHELVTIVRERGALLRAFVTSSGHDPEFIENGLRLRRRVSRRVSDLLLTRREALSHPDPELAIDLGVQFAFAFMLQNVIFGHTSAGGRTLGDAQVESEIARSFLAYVGVRGDEAVPDPAPPTAPQPGDRRAP